MAISAHVTIAIIYLDKFYFETQIVFLLKDTKEKGWICCTYAGRIAAELGNLEEEEKPGLLRLK